MPILSLQLSLQSELCSAMCSAAEVRDERKLIPLDVHRLLDVAASPRQPYIVIYDSPLWAEVYKRACEFLRTVGGLLYCEFLSPVVGSDSFMFCLEQQTDRGLANSCQCLHCTCWRL